MDEVGCNVTEMRSAVPSDGEQPRSIWRIRLGSPSAFMPSPSASGPNTSGAVSG